MANKGTHLSKKTKEKIRKKLLGRRVSISSEFSLGHIPFNKGTKGLMKANKGSFKKGNIPNNYMGGLKICKDGIYSITDEKYEYECNGKKIIARKYENLARKKYREHHGEFDKKMIVIHKDGDKYNNEIENLELITKGELLLKNLYKNKKICITCGNEFMARTKKVMNCSHKCIKKYQNKLINKYQKEHRKKMREYHRKWRAKKLLLIN